LDKLAELEPDNADLYQRLVFGNIGDLDLVKMNLLKEHSDIFKENPQDLQRAVENKFPALFDESITHDSKEYQDQALNLKLEASTIKKKYLESLNKIELPDPAAEATKSAARIKELTESWKPKFEEIKKAAMKIPVIINSEDGKKSSTFFEIDIPEADKQSLAEYAENYVIQNQIPLSESVSEAVQQKVQMLWILNHLPEYNAKIAEESAKAVNGEWRKLVNNDRAPKGPNPPAASLEEASEVIYKTLRQTRF